jgi:hypothetical protein
LSQFGLFLNADTLFITFHTNEMVERLGRKLMADMTIRQKRFCEEYLVDYNARVDFAEKGVPQEKLHAADAAHLFIGDNEHKDVPAGGVATGLEPRNRLNVLHRKAAAYSSLAMHKKKDWHGAYLNCNGLHVLCPALHSTKLQLWDAQ